MAEVPYELLLESGDNVLLEDDSNVDLEQGRFLVAGVFDGAGTFAPTGIAIAVDSADLSGEGFYAG